MYLEEKGEGDFMHTGQKTIEDKGRDWSHSATKQGKPVALSRWKEARKEFPLEASEGGWSC